MRQRGQHGCHPMDHGLRLGWTLLVLFATFVLVRVGTSLFFGDLGWLGHVIALAIALVVARREWLKPEAGPGSVRAWAGAGAIALGTIGFVAGFFGPMIFAPEANQGPMLGLFITGPGGVILGAVAGALYGLKRQRES
jgi:hypothetical protein